MNSMKKNITDQTCGKGNRVKASGYVTKASPGPLLTTSVTLTSGPKSCAIAPNTENITIPDYYWNKTPIKLF